MDIDAVSSKSCLIKMSKKYCSIAKYAQLNKNFKKFNIQRLNTRKQQPAQISLHLQSVPLSLAYCV